MSDKVNIRELLEGKDGTPGGALVDVEAAELKALELQVRRAQKVQKEEAGHSAPPGRRGRPLLGTERQVADSYVLEPSMLAKLRAVAEKARDTDGKKIGKSGLIRIGIAWVLAQYEE